jgi:hypothetical protein
VSAAPMAFVIIVTPSTSWAYCNYTPPGATRDCHANPPPAPDAPPPPAPAPGPFGLSPSDVSVDAGAGAVTPGRVRVPWPHFCGPNIQTPIPFVGFQPCI